MIKNTLENQRIDVFKALADPVRLKIIKYLKDINHEVSCGEVGKKIKISKSSGSYHFKVLQDAGLINVRKEARSKFISINQDTFKKIVTDFYKNI